MRKLCKNIALFVFAMMAAMGVSSCSTVSHTALTANVDSYVVTLTVADLDVSKEKQTATANWNWNPFAMLQDHKAIKDAEAEMLRSTGSDVVVEPSYKITKRGFLRGGSVEVTGYPAKYTGFHSMTEKEAESINKLRFPTVSSENCQSLGEPKLGKREKTKNLFQKVGGFVTGIFH